MAGHEPCWIKTLTETANYPVCNDPKCNELNYDHIQIQGYCLDQNLVMSPNRFHLVPAAHFHLENNKFILSLQPQSKLL
ncbi:hypothetical protein BDW74DRAFT_148805 [Aspergillus multicolor]|uniref:uncharacterized protein n=1 Tax=Aspergillus multicolor TaxID=41759 RepID=UPI003CCDC1C4